jgi:predicted  nucleic acid-binding Zn-ribbon protein
MKLLKLVSLGCVFVLTAEVRAQEGGKPAAPDPEKRFTAALETMRKALKDLPPGAETDRIREALTKLENRYDELKGRLRLAQSDLEMSRDRAAWSERMLRKKYVSRQQHQADKARHEAAAAALARVRRELQDLLGGPGKPAGKER